MILFCFLCHLCLIRLRWVFSDHKSCPFFILLFVCYNRTRHYKLLLSYSYTYICQKIVQSASISRCRRIYAKRINVKELYYTRICDTFLLTQQIMFKFAKCFVNRPWKLPIICPTVDMLVRIRQSEIYRNQIWKVTYSISYYWSNNQNEADLPMYVR